MMPDRKPISGKPFGRGRRIGGVDSAAEALRARIAKIVGKGRHEALMNDFTGWLDDGVRLRHLREMSLFVGCLTAEEAEKLHAARISYSGATGTPEESSPSCDPTNPERYVATYMSEIVNVIVALDWMDARLVMQGTQFILTKTKAGKGPRR
jgi:hypothetical protein